MRVGMVLAGAIFVVSFVVHFLWESLQSFAYDCGQLTVNQATGYHVLASLGDGGLMLILYGAGWLLRRDFRWIEAPRPAEVAVVALLGSALAIAIEWIALNTGRWTYSSWMPILPEVGVGLLPVLQMLLLPLPIFWMAARLVRLPSRN